jgi:hypothetical protein
MAPPRCSGHDRSRSAATDTGAPASPHHGRAHNKDWQPHHRHEPWRAGCAETCTSGSEGGSQKPTGPKTGRALRPDPYSRIPTGEGPLWLASVRDAFSRRIVGWKTPAEALDELLLTHQPGSVATTP